MSPLRLGAACWLALLGAAVAAADGRAGGQSDTLDDASDAFWEGLRRQGLRVQLGAAAPVEATGVAGAAEGRPAEGGTAALLKDVFYGRPILRIPEELVLSAATLAHAESRQVLQEHLADLGPERAELLSSAAAVAAERRNASSALKPWLAAVVGEGVPPGLRLAPRQLRAIAGTTVEALPGALLEDEELLRAGAGRLLPCFAEAPLSQEESTFALGVVLRHAIPVEAEEAAAGASQAALVPLLEVLRVRRHPNASMALPLKRAARHASAVAAAEGAGGQRVLDVVARRDMRAGEEAPPLWLGRFSGSELALRHGEFYSNNPVGVGGRLALPENWSPLRKTPHTREYRKYNCSSSEAFEMRFNSRGWPTRPFIRCARIAYHLAQGSYKPTFVERMNLLDKWPPPKQYSIEEWLSWTQADQTINRQLHTYCMEMKKQLKETITSVVADEFRQSTDATDVLLWRIRSEESSAFRECVALARSISSTDS